MKRNLLIAEVQRTPWALEPNYGATMISVLQGWQKGDRASEETLSNLRAARSVTTARQQATARTAGGSIAVLPLYGIISQRAGMLQDYSGGTSTQQFASALREAVSDDGVSQILIDIDSPGGSVFGVQELASEIMQARVSKPIIGFADSTCASAAYWIGACCSELYSTPGGECGSIGVWQQHVDISKSLEEEGINVTLISAGRFKTEGNQFGPLLPEGKNFMQERTDQYYRAFTTAVARGRGVPVDTVRNGMGQGRMLGAQDALREKMIDGVATISEVIGGMQRNIKAGSRGASAVPGRSAAALAHSARIREIEIMEAGGAPPARAPSPRLARMLSEIAAMERGAR